MSNESGIVGASGGLVIDILNSLASKLNFTYVLHVAQMSTVMNVSIDANETVSQLNFFAKYSIILFQSFQSREIHLLTTDIPTEVLNLLTENRIILGAVASTVNERYKRLVNFSVPISIQPYSFLLNKPREVSRIYLFTAPFTHGVSL